MKKSKIYLCSFLQPIESKYNEPYFSSAYEWLMELYGKRVLFGEINIDEYYSFPLDMYITCIKFNEYGASFELDSWVKYLESNIGHSLIESGSNYIEILDESFRPVVRYKHELTTSNEPDDFLAELDEYIKKSTGTQQNTLFWSNTP